MRFERDEEQGHWWGAAFTVIEDVGFTIGDQESDLCYENFLDTWLHRTFLFGTTPTHPTFLGIFEI